MEPVKKLIVKRNVGYRDENVEIIPGLVSRNVDDIGGGARVKIKYTGVIRRLVIAVTNENSLFRDLRNNDNTERLKCQVFTYTTSGANETKVFPLCVGGGKVRLASPIKFLNLATALAELRKLQHELTNV